MTIDDLSAPQSPLVNLDAERSVVGAILLDPEAVDEVADLIRPDDFYDERNKRLFHNLLDMRALGHSVDLTLLVERLRKNNELEACGSEAYLAELMTSVQVAAHVRHYAQIVKDRSDRRALRRAGEEIAADASSLDVPTKDAISRGETKIFAINDKRSSKGAEAMRGIVFEAFQLVDERAKGKRDGLPTGFVELDEMIGGLRASELTIIAARPSMGKTAFATNIADFVAVEQKKTVLFFSLEMAKTELALRMICARGRVRASNLRGALSPNDARKFTEAGAKLGEAPLYIDDSPSRTVSEIGAIARRLKKKESLDLIVIDYLGLIEPDNPRDSRQEQVSKISRRLKGLARELEVPVVCLSQLNRMTEQMKDNRPRLSHLRESGAIEQDADVVIFVHREEYYHTAQEAQEKNLQGMAEIIVAKDRNGPVGSVNLSWNNKYTLFANLARQCNDDYSEDFDDFS